MIYKERERERERERGGEAGCARVTTSEFIEMRSLRQIKLFVKFRRVDAAAAAANILLVLLILYSKYCIIQSYSPQYTYRTQHCSVKRSFTVRARVYTKNYVLRTYFVKSTSYVSPTSHP